MPENVRNKIEAHRKKRDLTQEQLAQAVGVSRQTIVALEKGNYTPSVLLALKISKCFSEPVEALFKISL